MTNNITYKTFLKTIGTSLRAERLHRQKETEAVAQAVNLLTEVLEQIEDGTYNWDVEMIIRLCSYYGITISDIVEQPEYVFENQEPATWKR